MDKQVVEVLAVAAVGLAGVVHLTAAQLRRRLGDSSHQRRGIGILVLLLIVLYILERGLQGTSFKPEPVSFWIHMVFAHLTVIALLAIAITGSMARIESEGTMKIQAAKIHRLLNKPAGKGALLWLSASIVSGTVFVVASLISMSKLH